MTSDWRFLNFQTSSNLWKVTWKSWQKLDHYVPGIDSRHKVFSALDGKALIELAYNDSIISGSKTAGFSIRYFDSNLDKWVMLQSWPGRNASNMSSLQGTHHHGRIQLYQYGTTSNANNNVPVGTAYANRYTFSDVSENSFRWDTGFSTDSMRTWFTRNIAEFNRLQDFTSLIEVGENAWFTYGDGYNCDDSVLEELRPFLGEWEGKTTFFTNDQTSIKKTFRVMKPFLSNCAVMGYQIIQEKDQVSKEIVFATYLRNSSEWVFYTLNNIKGESQTLYFSKSLKGGEASFLKREIFDVPSDNKIEIIKWVLKNSQKQEIEGYNGKNEPVYKMSLKKMN